jgi:hypothetical protein
VARNDEHNREIIEYLAGAPDEERGALVAALLGHALIYLLLLAAEATWAGSTALRIWRRRDAGLAQAVRTGVHKPSLGALLTAHVAYELLRRFGVRLLEQRRAE